MENDILWKIGQIRSVWKQMPVLVSLVLTMKAKTDVISLNFNSCLLIIIQYKM